MKAFRFLAVVLLLVPTLAWAEEAAPTGSVPAAQAIADSLFEGGGCLMPDIAGLSDEEAGAALEAAGFGIAPVAQAAPACPTTFNCTSITNCGVGPVCGVTDIGPCCTTGGGLGLCCVTGSIKVRTCPCVCTGNPCNITCPNSNDVKWRCA